MGRWPGPAGQGGRIPSPRTAAPPGGPAWFPAPRRWSSGDVEAISTQEAYLLSAGTGTDSRIYHTVDGGKTWELQFKNREDAAFYDCFAFWDPDHAWSWSTR